MKALAALATVIPETVKDVASGLSDKSTRAEALSQDAGPPTQNPYVDPVEWGAAGITWGVSGIVSRTAKRGSRAVKFGRRVVNKLTRKPPPASGAAIGPVATGSEESVRDTISRAMATKGWRTT